MLLMLLGLTFMRLNAEQAAERVRAIVAPATPLPSEAESQGISRFSFVLYGDTRGRHDGVALQAEHSLVVDGILGQIQKLRNTEFPVRFILQTGDAVVHGQEADQWNVSFVPLIDRLTTLGGVPYFLVPGNHDVSTATRADAPERQAGLRNLLDSVKELIPPDGSPRRLDGYPTYSFGYGNTFVIGFDSIIANDDKQYLWVKNQLEGLDRKRYVNVFVFCHHPPFSSGPHSVVPDESILTIRSRYMPLFHAHHVRAVLAGHEHLYEHWVEHYSDHTGLHRMDFLVSGGGGAPLYAYKGEPNLTDYLQANQGMKVQLQHLVKPGPADNLTPYHFVLIHVDGEKISLEVFGVGAGTVFHPYPGKASDLQDPLH
jgi:3',5'-cyclic AMP phosphodiesterase CpdA